MTLATLAALVPDLAKDDGMDVAGWNAANPLHPRSGDGRFSLVGEVVRKLENAFGDVLHHKQVGAEEHPFSDRGVIAVHHGGKLSLSKVDDEGEHSTLAVLDHDQIGGIGENIESAITDLRNNDYPPGTHFDFSPDEPDDLPVVSFGTMSDGRKYVSLDTDEDGIQLDLEHAEAFLDDFSEAHSIAFQAAQYPDDPHVTRPLPQGHTLERRQVISTDGDNDLITGLVSTPDGVRMRLGIGGTEEHPAKRWTGGRGPMVADLGPAEARDLGEALEQAIEEMDDYHARMDEADEAYDAWYETPSGRRLSELHEQGWGLWSSGDRDIVQRDTGRRLPSGAQEKELAPPDIDAEVRRLRTELDTVADGLDLVDEGEAFSTHDVPTPWGTIQIDLIGNSTAYENPVEARITVRPAGVSAEDWEGRHDTYVRAVELSPKKIKQLRKLTAGYLNASAGTSITKTEGAGMNAVYAWAPITKVEQQDDGTVMVYGPVSDAGLDRDKQRMNQAWLDQAMPRWMAEGGNVREMHDKHRAVGVGVGLTKDDSTGAHLLAACIVDSEAIKKVLPGPNGRPPVLKGFSIGVKEPRLDMSKAEAPNGEVVGGYVCEVSIVDRPSNPRTTFTMVKADTPDGGLAPVENPTIVEAGESEGEPNGWEQAEEVVPDAPKVDAPTAVKRDFTAAQRRKAARSGAAMKNESFPIYNETDLKNAIHLVGNAKDPAAAKRHIVARARALGLVARLPEDWGISKADAVVADLTPLLQLDELHKYDEAADIANAAKAMALIARLIASEAAELAKGREEEADDIRILLDAHKALCWFKCREENQAGQGDGTAPVDGAYTPSDVDMAKDSPAMGYKTEHPDLVKAVAEATAAKERAEDLAAQVAQLNAKLAAMPAPGGPVLRKTAAAVRTTEPNQRHELAQQLLVKADHTQDPVLARGYRDRARDPLKADS